MGFLLVGKVQLNKQEKKKERKEPKSYCHINQSFLDVDPNVWMQELKSYKCMN